ncbi:MAG TPA: gluconate 2-dehydrogenase subunit 3 family protein [Rhizomicrobium sp.]|jgi:hypothetical protein|nr:gluconate 2-dehydrogenase subunit 3 family protein [Rhizomicrobium sp.]
MGDEFQTPYPSYNVLDKWNSPSWNGQTRRVVAHRLNNVPDRRFFTEPEWTILSALCHRVIPQPERADPVPIAPFIDQELYEGKSHGTHYATLPPDKEAWRRGLAAIDEEARHSYQRPFADLSDSERDAIIKAVDTGEVHSSVWGDMPPREFLRKKVLRDIVRIYYAHPSAWSEIGFGGPAAPRGYLRLTMDRRDPWEAREERQAHVRGAPKP